MNDSIDLSPVMQGHNEQEKFALDQFMTEFLATLLLQVNNFRDSTGVVPRPLDTDIVHLYLDTTFSRNYVVRDQMTLGGLPT